ASERDETGLPLASFGRSRFSEPGGVDRRERHTDFRALGEDVEYTLHRNRDADVVRRFRQVANTGIAAKALERLQPWIDGIDSSGEPEIRHLLENAAAERRRMIGGTHQRDR